MVRSFLLHLILKKGHSKAHPEIPEGKTIYAHVQLICLLKTKMISHSSGIVRWQVSPFGGDLEGAELFQQFNPLFNRRVCRK